MVIVSTFQFVTFVYVKNDVAETFAQQRNG